MSKTRGPVFEVALNKVARWFWRERAANGEIACVSQAYSTKWAAKRAAKRKAGMTTGATVRILEG